MKEYFYFDNASTTWPNPEPAYRFMDGFFRSHGVNSGRAGRRLAVKAENMIDTTRQLLAQFFGFGSDASWVIFTQDVTDSLNMVMSGFMGPGDHPVISRIEHN